MIYVYCIVYCVHNIGNMSCLYYCSIILLSLYIVYAYNILDYLLSYIYNIRLYHTHTCMTKVKYECVVPSLSDLAGLTPHLAPSKQYRYIYIYIYMYHMYTWMCKYTIIGVILVYTCIVVYMYRL